MEKKSISLVISKIEKINLTMPETTLHIVKDYDKVDKTKVNSEELKKSIEEKKKQAAQQIPVQK